MIAEKADIAYTENRASKNIQLVSPTGVENEIKTNLNPKARGLKSTTGTILKDPPKKEIDILTYLICSGYLDCRRGCNDSEKPSYRQSMLLIIGKLLEKLLFKHLKLLTEETISNQNNNSDLGNNHPQLIGCIELST